jgi:hypothetical protein
LPDRELPPAAAAPGAAALAAVQEEFFSFLAREFPTLCLHDEFIFFPRVSAAWEHWFKLPHLESGFLESAAARLSGLLSQLPRVAPEAEPGLLAEEAVLLRQSLESVRRELGPGGPWRQDPFLYLKAASLAWAPVLDQAPQADWRRPEKLAELLHQTARLFQRGRRQLEAISQPAKLLAAGAFADARQFLGEVLPAFLTAQFSGGGFETGLRQMDEALHRLQETVASLPVTRTLVGEAGLAEILANWGWSGGLDEIAGLLDEEVAESQAALAQLADRIHPGRSWTTVRQSLAEPRGQIDRFSLYGREVAKLWDFWQTSPVLPPLTGRVVVAETPLYLRSLRSSASYAAPWGPPEENPGYFYVTPESEDWRHHLLHHRFLSAHETVPGHHFLDATRLGLASPLRRQYESPWFYEGWACYAETLLISEGYLHDPRELLVGWQRRLWRALRGRADLDLQRGRLDLKGGLELLRRAGYPEATARAQVLQLALTPGYQLCYTIGLKEILRLRDRFALHLGLARFHEVLLSGGQLPFSLVARRLQAASGL